jgi:hypothetical protein
MVGSVGITAACAVIVMGMVAGAESAHGTSRAALTAAGVPAGTPGSLNAVAAVPHSSDVWAIGEVEGVGTNHFFVARRRHGRWQRMTTPNLGGEFGELDAVAAPTGKSVWISGGKAVHRAEELPVIFGWNGKRFVAARLPKLVRGEFPVESISASSASNAWAVGGFESAANHKQVALHWNGKKWSAVPTPAAGDDGLRVVSTSGPKNAWGLGSDGALVHWDGKVWAQDGTAPFAVQLDSIATSGPSLAYAVGFDVQNNRLAILRFNGQTWSRAPLGKGVLREGQLISVAVSGRAAWAVGNHDKKNGVTEPVILHSTGGAWRAQRAPGSDFSLSAISAASTKRAYAVGTFELDVEKTFFDIYNGHHWTGAPSRF